MNNGNQRLVFPPDVLVYRVPHLFQIESVFHALGAIESVTTKPSTLVLQLDDVPMLDGRGTQAIAGLVERCRRSSMRMIVVGLRGQASEALRRAGIAADLGEIGLCRDLREARQVVSDYQQIEGR